ncbi:SRPBCC family protein [Tabrizicola sp. J26]|uniref:SRPBCC family protein n=1 Tax=Alitabrizicola rongguiensis TaxID=2909234 RepID=UPI001F1DD8EC|nr:SRPBCC family protein [Tabrizicola rongguiensis]MCF1709182.1 SRPBCC family protein [Tabrizicola rongguiensis]
MTRLAERSPYGTLIEPTTFRIERRLPGPIERVWSYLTDSDLRQLWLASGKMELKVGAPFELVWRNDRLTDDPGQRPEEFGEEHRMASRILLVDPPRKLVFSWFETGEVTIELVPDGEDVLLTLTHRRLSGRSGLLSVSAGWHAHLDVLMARLNGVPFGTFWDKWRALKEEYTCRIPE